MARTVVGVLRGGNSSEYDLSLKTGAAVMNALPDEKYNVRDILIDRSGIWHIQGRPVEPARILHGVDVVFNALHGGIGEDGTISRIIKRSGIPHTGSSPDASALSFNKANSRRSLRGVGIKMPRAVSFGYSDNFSTGDLANMVFQQFGPPYIVKPLSSAFSSGVLYVPTINELPNAIGNTLDYYGNAIIEEFIRGREVTVGIVNNFRSEDLYALPPAEIICSDEGLLITPKAWREGLLRTTCPSESHHIVEQRSALLDTAKKAHSTLGLSGYSTSDFIVTSRGPYLLEVDALPGLYDEAPFATMLSAVGASLPEFVEHNIYRVRNTSKL
jgi:D-alanine-D-alanine ligase